MIGADEYVREYGRRIGLSVLSGSKAGRVTWFTMGGQINEYVEQGGTEVSRSVFSVRPALRALKAFKANVGP